MNNKQEELWSGKFGDEYTDRNVDAAFASRSGFWAELAQIATGRDVLEVGCGSGGNLRHLAKHYEQVWGIDINRKAVTECRKNVPDANVCLGNACPLPFRDRYFDLVVSCGFLIHVDPNGGLRPTMYEMSRCSHHWLLCMEYESENFERVPYRNQQDALWKGPYSKIFTEMGWHRAKGGLLTKDQGFDDVTWTLLHR